MSVTAAQIKKVVKVASGIIYSQEGNYGSVNKNDNDHGMSIGKCQWNAYWGRALPLLQTIVKANEKQAQDILSESLYKEIAESKPNAWDKQKRTATEEEAKELSALLSTKEGKQAQDKAADEDITAYVKNGVKTGLVSLQALAYYADIENQGGSSSSKRIAESAGNAVGGVSCVGIEEIYAYALKDLSLGKYESRRTAVYNAVKLSDLSNEKDEAKEIIKEEEKTPQKATQTLTKGNIVTFKGGNVYISSTAEKAAKVIDKVSTCKVTQINEKGTHPYHCISQDGKGVYGWVDKKNVK